MISQLWNTVSSSTAEVRCLITMASVITGTTDSYLITLSDQSAVEHCLLICSWSQITCHYSSSHKDYRLTTYYPICSWSQITCHYSSSHRDYRLTTYYPIRSVSCGALSLHLQLKSDDWSSWQQSSYGLQTHTLLLYQIRQLWNTVSSSAAEVRWLIIMVAVIIGTTYTLLPYHLKVLQNTMQ